MGKCTGMKAPGPWLGENGPALPCFLGGWKAPQPPGQPRRQEDQRNFAMQPTESGTMAGNTCTSETLPFPFPICSLL